MGAKMVDYNVLLSHEERIELIREKIEDEKQELAEIVEELDDKSKVLEILEEYYKVLDEINKKYKK